VDGAHHIRDLAARIRRGIAQEVDVKGRVVLSTLATIGMLTVPVTGANAGAGGTPSPLTSFFVCNPINGDSAGQTVDVESPTLGNRLGIKLGNGTLACAFARLFRAGTTQEIAPNPALEHQQLKCYSFTAPREPTGAPPAKYTVVDEVMGREPDVSALDTRYVCAPATLLGQ